VQEEVVLIDVFVQNSNNSTRVIVPKGSKS